MSSLAYYGESGKVDTANHSNWRCACDHVVIVTSAVTNVLVDKMAKLLHWFHCSPTKAAVSRNKAYSNAHCRKEAVRLTTNESSLNEGTVVNFVLSCSLFRNELFIGSKFLTNRDVLIHWVPTGVFRGGQSAYFHMKLRIRDRTVSSSYLCTTDLLSTRLFAYYLAV